MSDRPDLAQMGEPELRAWLERLPAKELSEIIISYVRAFLRDGADELGSSGGPLGELLEMSFAQVISFLKEKTRLPELSRLRVDGDLVKFQTAAGSDVIINATGLQDGPGVPGLGGRGGFARSTPDPMQRPPAGARRSAAADDEDEFPPRRAEAAPAAAPAAPAARSQEGAVSPGAPRRAGGGGLFGASSSGSGESRGPGARTGGGPSQPAAAPASRGAGPARPAQPPRAKPDAKPEEKKGGASDRFSMLEFD